jgi:hypothetical protein
MKVLKNNFNEIAVAHETKMDFKPYPRLFTCENCDSELEYEESDLRMGVLGCMHLDCPLCGYENMLEDNESNIELTKDNVRFPVHFFHTSKEDGAVDICDNEHVKKYINDAINYFRENKDDNDFDYHVATGNLSVHVRRFEGDEDYYVEVTNNYYNTYIPFESEDY